MGGQGLDALLDLYIQLTGLGGYCLLSWVGTKRHMVLKVQVSRPHTYTKEFHQSATPLSHPNRPTVGQVETVFHHQTST